jgi:hypothetical protein
VVEGAFCVNVAYMVNVELAGTPWIVTVGSATIIRHLRKGNIMDPIAIIRDIGLPTGTLVAVGYGIWQGTAWVAKEVIVPLRDRHFAFLSSLESTLSAIADTQKTLASELERVSGMIKCPRQE